MPHQPKILECPFRSRYGVSAVIALIGVLVWSVPQLAQQRPTTLRQALAGVIGLDSFPDAFLDAPIPEPKPGRRYVVIGLHINPSAERFLVLSADFKLVHDLYGWELVTLPNESIVYHQSQVHFASTHSLQISVFDPTAMTDTPIYPPASLDAVRRDFVDRVAKVYKARGEDWFRENNHHMDATRFDTYLIGPVTVNERAGSMTFLVGFGDPGNARDPLPFSERVLVTCAPLAPAAGIQCRETRAP